MTREIETVRSQDLATASFLYASCPEEFEGLELSGSYYLFVFRGKDCGKLLAAFQNRKATINAKAYAEATKNCKDIIFSQLRQDRWNTQEERGL